MDVRLYWLDFYRRACTNHRSILGWGRAIRERIIPQHFRLSCDTVYACNVYTRCVLICFDVLMAGALYMRVRTEHMLGIHYRTFPTILAAVLLLSIASVYLNYGLEIYTKYY